MDFNNMIYYAQKVVDKYGYEAQSRQLIEEMAELTQVLNKDWRLYQKFYKTNDTSMHPKLDESHKKIVDELADVYFVFHQVAYAIGAFQNGELEKAIDFKINRQMERIAKSEEEEQAKKIKTADELLEIDENLLNPDEKERLARIKSITPAARELFQIVEKSKRELIMKLEKERDAILDYLNGFSDGTHTGEDENNEAKSV
ncbi:MAG: hypothetical protein K2L82_14380 [Lachnospiraceae bacterium]|nr:hypothetical protein [Lachnospiraceae bacterium]